MTLVCDDGSRKWNDPVSLLVLLCTQMGGVTGNALYAQRYQCDTCDSLYLIGGNCAAVFGIVTARLGKTAREGGN
jgi:hypothetical protein